jgi:hypothetical protein
MCSVFSSNVHISRKVITSAQEIAFVVVEAGGTRCTRNFKKIWRSGDIRDLKCELFTGWAFRRIHECK